MNPPVISGVCVCVCVCVHLNAVLFKLVCLAKGSNYAEESN